MTVLLGFDVTPNTTTTSPSGRVRAEPLVALATGTATEAVLSAQTPDRPVTIVVYDSSDNLLSSTAFTSVIGDNVVTLSTPVNITQGETYRLGYFADGGLAVDILDTNAVWWDNSVTTTYPNIPDPFVTDTNSNAREIRFFLQSTAPSYSITDIDGDNSVRAGQDGVVITMSAS